MSSHTRHGLLAATLLLGMPGVLHAHEHSGSYQRHDLVSDGGTPADHTDPNLVNAWGIAFNPTGPVWVANNGTGTSTLYDGTGTAASLVVNIPGPPGSTGNGRPTGIVFNGSADFAVSAAGVTAAARFIFATEDGVIAGWSPTVNRTNAIGVVATPGAIYKGLALGSNGVDNFLVATNFAARKIDVFDKAFQPTTAPGGFVDPGMPKDYSPFGIQNIGGDIYVTYAKKLDGDDDETAGPGLGLVSVFDASGHFVRRVASHGKLNAPWGIVLAPASFGRFANDLLVGNFGDGAILAFDSHSGEFRGRLHQPDGHLLKIDGLWGIAFGNGIQNQPTNVLFFAAGPDDESHGVYGKITTTPGGRWEDDSD